MMNHAARTSGRGLRTEQVEHTRARIVLAAERLFAEHGVSNVSNRQIGEAAGQGNTTAVSYHFGSKNDLVRAIVARHAVPMEQIRRELADRYDGSTDLRDWVTCVVRPVTDHLAALGSPSWYARFAAQVMTEPTLRQLAAEELGAGAVLHTVTGRLHECLPHLSPAARAQRDLMARTLIVHFCAEREGTADPAWEAIANGLINAVEGLYRAPDACLHNQHDHHRRTRPAGILNPRRWSANPSHAAEARPPASRISRAEGSGHAEPRRRSRSRICRPRRQ